MAETNPQPFYNVMPEAATSKSVNPRKVSAAKADAVFTKSTGPTATNITLQAPKRGLKAFFSRKAVLIPSFIILLAIIGTVVYFATGGKKEVAPPTTTAPQEQTTNPDVTTPGDWLARFFGSDTCVNINNCGDKADPDRDGLSNKEEFDTGTDPNNPDADTDGISDGDEKLIFGTDPLLSKTYRDGTYNDADFVKGGYDIQTNNAYSPERLAVIKQEVKTRGLHQPTLTTIGPVALSLYDFKDPNAPTLDSSIDQSPQAKLDRDTQRQTTIKKIGSALLKYKAEKKSFPATNDFVEMSDAIKSYNTVATNYNDPINKDQYVYGYSVGAKNQDFTLSYYSETQNQLIKYLTRDAEDAATKENAENNNQQRITDLENIKSALLVYSSTKVDSNSDQIYVFPTKDQYPNALVEAHTITAVPKDPLGSPYEYTVNDKFDSFTLKAIFQSPAKGTTGYMCNEIECKNY